MKTMRRLLKRMIFLSVAGTLTAGDLRAEETPRTWTNQEGKTVKGVLKEKGDGWVKLLIGSRIHKIETATLSDEDQEYVEEATIYKTFRMRITTVKAVSSNADRGIDIRKLKVNLENVQDRKLSFRLIWIAQTPGRKKYGPYREVTAEYDADGDYFHEEKFYRHSTNGAQYKGYAARIKDEEGNVLAEIGDPRPFVRFLDEREAEEVPR